MANMNGGVRPGLDQGTGSTNTDPLANFLKVFSGEVLTAFRRRSVTMNRHMTRNIPNGKAATFPVIGRTKAAYLQAGESLDDKRKDIKHTERVINIDGLLTADVLIYDIDEAMLHYDVRSEYSTQIGESLALAADGAVLAEIAKLCNDTTRPSNIAGLGTSKIYPIGAAADLTDQVTLGKAIIAGLTKARAGLTTNYVPPTDRTFFTTPDNFSAILAALMPNSANYQAILDPEKGTLRNIMGFEVVEVPHLTVGGAGNTRDDTSVSTLHGFPTTGAVTLANVAGMFMHRSAVGTVTLKNLALERARRPDYQADMIIGKYAMGHGGLRPEAAGALVFGAIPAPSAAKGLLADSIEEAPTSSKKAKE